MGLHCPITGINIPRFLLAAVIGFAFIFGFDYGVHHKLLMDVYQQTADMWRPMDQMKNFMPYVFLYQALLVVIIGFIYTRNHEGKGLIEGIRFGLMIGVLMALLNASAYIWMPIPKTLALGWAGAGLGNALGIGIIFSLLYKK